MPGKNPESFSDSGLSNSVSTFASFKRLIHERGDIVLGISRNRRRLKRDSVAEIVDSLMSNSIYRNAIAPEPFPNDYSKMKQRRRLFHASPEIEIVWTAHVLKHFIVEIERCNDVRNQYATCLLGGELDLAQEFLNDIVSSFGCSLWSLNASLTLAQLRYGINAQKELISNLLSSGVTNPIVAYIAFMISYSLEDQMTLAAITRDLDDESFLTGYARYHIAPTEWVHIDEPSECLRLEENSPIIDRFDTLLDVLHIYFVRGEQLELIDGVVGLFDGVSDPRLTNLRALIKDDSSCVPENKLLIACCDAYAEGSYKLVQDKIAAIGSLAFLDASLYEVMAHTGSIFIVPEGTKCLANDIISAMRSFIEVDQPLPEVRVALERLSLHTRSLPHSRMISALLDRTLDMPVATEYTFNQRMWALCSVLDQPHHYKLLFGMSSDWQNRVAEKLNSAHTSELMHAICALPWCSVDNMNALSMPSDRKFLYSAYKSFNVGDYMQAALFFEKYKNIHPQVSPRTITIQYALFRNLDQVEPALESFVDSVLERSWSYILFQISEFVTWVTEKKDETDSRACLNRSILLHVNGVYTGPKYQNDISDSFEDTLDYFDVQSPMQLINEIEDKRRLIYFLRNVATVERMEDCIYFDSVDDIENERMRILQWLLTNDNSARNSYTQEISAITKAQELARLSVRFEKSKIYIHEEGLRRVFELEIRPAFLRYRQALSDPQLMDNADQIEKAMRKILKESEPDTQLLAFPSTKADAVFHLLIQSAYETLGLDPNNGFKTYLSTRILHAVLEGELRAPFYNESLLFSTDLSDPQREFLETWEPHIHDLKAESRGTVAVAAVRFSQKVTEAIIRIKDERIRMWSKEHPRGLFNVKLDEVEFENLKSRVTSLTSYDDFFEEVVESFWDSLETCLHDVRYELSVTFRRTISQYFDAFETTLNSVPGPIRPTELQDAIARARVSFSTRLERVAAWFSRGNGQPDVAFSPESAAQLAQLITNNCYPLHPLKVEFFDDAKINIGGESLNPFVDLLTNCLQNAAEHSGFVDRAPDVKMFVRKGVDDEYQFEVRSELAKDTDLEKCRSEIDRLLYDDSIHNAYAVAGEGKTGIRKMRRILTHDLRSSSPLRINVSESEGVSVSFSVIGRRPQ